MPIKRQWYLDDPVFEQIWEQVKPYTMTSVERGYALYTAVKFIVEKKVNGNIVESGVWRGGSSMLIALTLLELNSVDRDIYLFDTYSGMPEPSSVDVDLYGKTAKDQLTENTEQRKQSAIWAYAELHDVKKNMRLTKYPEDKIHYIKGDVTNSAKKTVTRRLALLRLDTDWYTSTKAELQNFWPRINRNGVLIIDDYGHWKGAKLAVDEFFAANEKAGFQPVFLQSIDYTGRLAIKAEAPRMVPWNTRYDYYPEAFNCPDLSSLFPHAQNTNTDTCPDKRLRRQVPHIWRTDTREKPNKTGNISTEEAALLYALAKQKEGSRGIEIGSHFGWSTAHLLQAGLFLDAIDPAFSNKERFRQVSDSLQKWVDEGSIKLWPGYSPQIIPAISATQDQLYSFAFVDGNHDNEGPILDVKALMPFLTTDARIVFHDLTFSDVAAAVRYLKNIGWQVRVYNTMQVMAVAWREGIEPVEYAGDESHAVKLPPHLLELDTTIATFERNKEAA